MAITINTNMAALIVRNNLNKATDEMNEAMERLSSGFRINSPKDDPAGFAIVSRMTAKISAFGVASKNVKLGENLLDTAEGTLEVINDNLQRINDLITEAANGTYSDTDKQAIADEIQARVDAIKDLAKSTNFNGIKLFSDSNSAGITLQTGPESSNRITLDSSIFAAIDNTTLVGLDSLASTIYNSNTKKAGSESDISGLLDSVSGMLSTVTARESMIGAAQNRLESTSDWIDTQTTNLKSARSTIRDADIAEEAAKYISAQIRQAACAALLLQANSMQKMALTLIQGATSR